MAKIGSQIKETRLRKGLTLDRIADDTNISVRFLSKIENDDFSGFPGELYTLGFIRNYAEYLGMDADEILKIHREPEKTEESSSETAPEEIPGSLPAEEKQVSSESLAKPISEPTKPVKKPRPRKQVQSKPNEGAREPSAKIPEPATPAPEREPLSSKEKSATNSEKAKKNIIWPFAVIASGLIVVGALAWIIFGAMLNGGKADTQRKAVEYRIEGERFERRLYEGDSLLVAVGADIYRLKLAAIEDKARLDTPFGPLELGLGSPGTLDVDNDGAYDFSITAQDYEPKKAAPGVLLKVEFAPPEVSIESGKDVTIPGTENAAAPAASETGEIAILRSTRGPYPLVVQVTFRGTCLFRYEVDRKEWVEKYYTKGESISITMNSSLTVWASNAQAAKVSFQAGGSKPSDLELGSPGEVAVKKIGWTKSGSAWTLVATELD